MKGKWIAGDLTWRLWDYRLAHSQAVMKSTSAPLMSEFCLADPEVCMHTLTVFGSENCVQSFFLFRPPTSFIKPQGINNAVRWMHKAGK